MNDYVAAASSATYSTLEEFHGRSTSFKLKQIETFFKG
jgi:hypothetical protein